MRTVVRQLEGIVIGDQIDRATEILKDEPVGSRLVLTSFNGGEMWVKEADGVRVSTLQEWEHYWCDKEKGFE